MEMPQADTNIKNINSAPEQHWDVKKIDIILKIKVFQFLFFAIFAFGIAWILSDIVSFLNIPISPGGIGTTIFGITGMLGCEILIRWVDKHFFIKKGE